VSEDNSRQRDNGFSSALQLEDFQITEKKQKKMILGKETNSNATVGNFAKEERKIRNLGTNFDFEKYLFTEKFWRRIVIIDWSTSILTSSASNTMLVIFFQMFPTASTF
jgi:hypothetical protein